MSDINILLICDDYWHPAEIVEKGIADFAKNCPGYHFDIVHDGKDILTPEMLGRYPVIINAKNNSINSANKEPWFEEGVSEVCPAQIDEETAAAMKEAAEKACEALGIEVYARPDFLMDEDGRLYCVEINTLPGLTPASLLPKSAAETGLSYNEFCELVVNESLKKYE